MHLISFFIERKLVDRNTKIAFGVCGVVWLWGMYKQFRIYETVTGIEDALDVIAKRFEQEEVDEKFVDIADDIGHLGDFPEDI